MTADLKTFYICVFAHQIDIADCQNQVFWNGGIIKFKTVYQTPSKWTYYSKFYEKLQIFAANWILIYFKVEPIVFCRL